LSSAFNVDKGDLMERVLDRYQVRYNRSNTRWQKVSCLNDAMHAHGDRNPSASVNITEGKYKCFGCDLYGDAFDIMLELEQTKAPDVLKALDMKAGESESEWLF